MVFHPALFSSETDQWNTPTWLVERIVKFMGRIDLDPCSGEDRSVPADIHFTKNGLECPWLGKVYMNPPYGREIGKWVEKARSEDGIEEIIMLLPARTDTRWFQPLLHHYSYTICFIAGRLKFGGAANSAPFPSALVYRGPANYSFVEAFHDLGGCV